MAITDTAGAVKVQYEYDAWGKVIALTGSLASTLGQQNPMRYRGYYLDVETGYYYLQSRYYDPQWKRFLNADASEVLFVENAAHESSLFTYCFNNSPNLEDPNGYLPYGLSIFMYIFAYGNARSLNGKRVDLSYGYVISGYMKDRLRNATVTISRIKSLIKKTSASNRTKRLKKATNNFSGGKHVDSDLRFSVGNANHFIVQVTRTLTIKKGKRKYEVDIWLEDKYDFKEFKKNERDQITTFINNYFGYNPQKQGKLVPYLWRFYCYFDYYA